MSIEKSQDIEALERRWSGFILPPPETAWPTWSKVRAEMSPHISDEECAWELESRIELARQQRKERDANNQGVQDVLF